MKPERIYIVDDEEAICLLLQSLLKKEEIESKYSTEITDVVPKIVQFKTEVLFLDLNLKDGSGFSIIADLKDKLPHLKIIIISAHNSEVEISNARNMGIEHFLPKPLNRELILETLKQIED